MRILWSCAEDIDYGDGRDHGGLGNGNGFGSHRTNRTRDSDGYGNGSGKDNGAGYGNGYGCGDVWYTPSDHYNAVADITFVAIRQLTTTF